MRGKGCRHAGEQIAEFDGDERELPRRGRRHVLDKAGNCHGPQSWEIYVSTSEAAVSSITVSCEIQLTYVRLTPMQVILDREATMRDAVTVDAIRTPTGEERPGRAMAGLHATIVECL